MRKTLNGQEDKVSAEESSMYIILLQKRHQEAQIIGKRMLVCAVKLTFKQESDGVASLGWTSELPIWDNSWKLRNSNKG